ncbi:MAG: tail fiber domain-containing protein [Bacteroidota bacterium]
MKINQLRRFFFLFILFFVEKIAAQIGINATGSAPSTNAMLDISSTTKGLLIPRMNTAQRTTLTATATDGLTVYDTDTKGYWFYNGTSWQNLSTVAGNTPWLTSGDNIYNSNAANVGIGTPTPGAKLQVAGNTIINNDLMVGGTGFFGGTNGYSGTRVSSGGINIPVTFGDTPKSILFDWGYNNIKAGIGYKPTQTVYASDMYLHVWDNTSSIIFGRDDPFYANGQYFGEWMRLKGGNLGIGTPDPDSKLHIAGTTHIVGSLKIEDTFQGAGKVLTSDAYGLGKWQALPAAPNSGWTITGNNVYNTALAAGYVGIGTSTAGFPLNFSSSLGDKISLWGNAGNHYGFGVQSGLLQIHTDGSGSNIAFGHGQSGSFTERARIINGGEYGMSLKGRLQLTTGTNSAGLWLTNNANTINSAFIGMAADDQVGFYGGTGANWGLTMNTTNGNVGIGNSNAHTPLAFNNPFGKIAISLFKGGLGDVGLGVWSNELRIQCDGPAGKVAFGTLDAEGNYFELAKASNQNQKFTVNGYINVGGTIYSSDERFKKNIKKLNGSLDKVMQLSGYEYDWRDEEFKSNNFGKMHQIGLLAQNVEKIVPEAVQEIADGYKGVDYAKLVPLLIESIKDLKKEMDVKNKNIDLLISTLTSKVNEIDQIKKEFNNLKMSVSNYSNINK